MEADVATGQPKKRTFKKFSFRGVDLDALLDMSTDELVKLFSARARRRFQRGLTRKPMALIKKLRKAVIIIYSCFLFVWIFTFILYIWICYYVSGCRRFQDFKISPCRGLCSDLLTSFTLGSMLLCIYLQEISRFSQLEEDLVPC